MDNISNMKRTTVFLATFVFLINAASAQYPQRGAAPSRPTPRLPDGRVNLGPPPGETGLWAPAGIRQVSVNPKSVNRAGAATHFADNIKIEDVAFQPWARALHEERQAGD